MSDTKQNTLHVELISEHDYADARNIRITEGEHSAEYCVLWLISHIAHRVWLHGNNKLHFNPRRMEIRPQLSILNGRIV